MFVKNIPIMNVVAAANLKAKFIADFNKLRKSLYKGNRKDCTILKYMVCVIHDYEHFDNIIQEYLMSYEY